MFIDSSADWGVSDPLAVPKTAGLMLERGIARKEFRAIDLTLASHLIVAPLVQMVTWRFSLAPCCPATQMPDPLKLLDMHADMAVRGLKI